MQLEKDMMKVPDLNPEDGKIIDQGESQPAQAPMTNSTQDMKVERDPKGRLSQREQSFEVCLHCLSLTTLCFLGGIVFKIEHCPSQHPNCIQISGGLLFFSRFFFITLVCVFNFYSGCLISVSFTRG